MESPSTDFLLAIVVASGSRVTRVEPLLLSDNRLRLIFALQVSIEQKNQNNNINKISKRDTNFNCIKSKLTSDLRRDRNNCDGKVKTETVDIVA